MTPPLALRQLQLIRKPDRDWNMDRLNAAVQVRGSYNSLENPIGIETKTVDALPVGQDYCYNSLENPIGIETNYHRWNK